MVYHPWKWCWHVGKLLLNWSRGDSRRECGGKALGWVYRWTIGECEFEDGVEVLELVSCCAGDWW